MLGIGNCTYSIIEMACLFLYERSIGKENFSSMLRSCSNRQLFFVAFQPSHRRRSSDERSSSSLVARDAVHILLEIAVTLRTTPRAPLRVSKLSRQALHRSSKPSPLLVVGLVLQLFPLPSQDQTRIILRPIIPKPDTHAFQTSLHSSLVP